MSRRRNPNDLIRIEDAIKVLCRKTCHPGMACPDIYCKEMWDEFEDVERVEVVRCKDCIWFEDANYECGICGFFEEARCATHYCGEGVQKDGDA